jgi:nucleotide-binding universal stress UspA family protein
MRILVGTDGSDSANRAVDFAARMAKHLNTDLHIAHVIAGDGQPEILELAQQEHSTIGEIKESLASDLVKAACHRVEELGVAAPRISVLNGDVAERMIALAGTNQTEAIVLGKRGRGRLNGLVLGSVSQKVVCLAPCTVIVVP